MEQFLADAFSSHTEPVWVLEVRRDRDRWLGSNPAADDLLHRLGVPTDNLEIILGNLGVPRSLIMGGLHSLGSFSTSTTRGIVHATKMNAEARPPLMVVSLHESVSEVHAWSEHSRLVMSLRVNEEASAAMQLARVAVSELEGVIGRLQCMVHDFNEQMNEVSRVPRQVGYDGPRQVLTADERARQG